MTITYQGKTTETSATTVAEFLSSQGLATSEAVIEYNGEIVSGDAAQSLALADGAELNAFRIVAGG